MALDTIPLPFGLRDVKLIPILADGTLDSANATDLPNARIFSFKETEEFEELKGDDRTVASHGAGPICEWELEAGGISFEAYQVMSGGTIDETGTTPAQKKSLVKKTTDSRPYFQVEGQAISDSGGDVHGIVYRCKADGDLEGGFENGTFLLTKASGKGYGDPEQEDKLYEFVQNETATAIDYTVGP